MATVSATVSLRCAAWSVALLLAPLTIGCVTLPHHWAGQQAPTKICNVVVAWQNNVGLAPDPVNNGKPTPILAGRMYLFGPQVDFPKLAEGGFTVELFDETNPGPPVKLEDWNIGADIMPGLMKKDFLGIGYTVLLPWGTFRPEINKIRLRTAYRPKDGTPVYTENVVTLSPSNGVIREGTTPLTPVNPALPKR